MNNNYDVEKYIYSILFYSILFYNYTSHLLLLFSFYWTGNRILDLVTLCQNHMHVV